jgi:MarR family transcriptional regulator, 2-MHQ and catechol-resistance regulon repressor
MPTHYRGNAEQVRALNAFIKLARAADSLSTRVSRSITGTGLTDNQFGVLEVLLHLGPLPQRDLAKKLLRSAGNMTMVIDNLEKRGLVRRKPNVEDRRVNTVHLTDDGRDLIARIFPGHVYEIVREMGVLTPAEQDELGRLCRKLGRGLGG